MESTQSYEEVWESFVSQRRLEFGGHRDPQWSTGHELSASFVIPVDVSRFSEGLRTVRQDLEMEPYVSLHPDHFMHVTLLLLGFLAPEPEASGEVSEEQLLRLGDEARRSLEGFAPFPVELANVNAFPGAVFIEVHDGGEISRLRDALCSGCGLKRPPGPPHLTLAYIQAPDDTPAPNSLVSAIGRYRDWPFGSLEIDHVALSILNIRDDYPEPRIIREIPLKENI